MLHIIRKWFSTCVRMHEVSKQNNFTSEEESQFCNNLGLHRIFQEVNCVLSPGLNLTVC